MLFLCLMRDTISYLVPHEEQWLSFSSLYLGWSILQKSVNIYPALTSHWFMYYYASQSQTITCEKMQVFMSLSARKKLVPHSTSIMRWKYTGIQLWDLESWNQLNPHNSYLLTLKSNFATRHLKFQFLAHDIIARPPQIKKGRLDKNINLGSKSG